MTDKEAIDRLEYFEPEDLVECAMYLDCVKTIRTAYEKEKEKNKKYSELIIKLRNLSSGVVTYEIINGKKYYGPRKNFSKQRLYEQFLEMKLLLKSEYIFLSNEDYLKELEKEE